MTHKPGQGEQIQKLSIANHPFEHASWAITRQQQLARLEKEPATRKLLWWKDILLLRNRKVRFLLDGGCIEQFISSRLGIFDCFACLIISAPRHALPDEPQRQRSTPWPSTILFMKELSASFCRFSILLCSSAFSCCTSIAIFDFVVFHCSYASIGLSLAN